MDVHPLVNAISHDIDNRGDRRLRDCFEGNKAMKRPERDCDDLRVLRRTSHENRAEEVLGLWSICRAGDDA